MSDPFSVISAALGIISSAYTICKASSDLVSGVKDAPKHISHVSENLHAFYPILRALKSAFEGIGTDSDGLIEDICAAVHRSVQNCVHIFRDLTLIVNKYRTLEPTSGKTTIRYEDGYGKLIVGKWSAIKWDFQKTEIDALNANLAHCRETCQLAVSTAHFIINQSNSKRVYEGLQKNNDLLKKLLKKVVQNDRSVRRDSIIADGDRASIAAYDTSLDGKSERMSQFLADVESALSSTPSSTPRISVASKEPFGDDELQELRASVYELKLNSLDYATGSHQNYIQEYIQDYLPGQQFIGGGRIGDSDGSMQVSPTTESSPQDQTFNFPIEGPDAPSITGHNHGWSARMAFTLPQSNNTSPVSPDPPNNSTEDSTNIIRVNEPVTISNLPVRPIREGLQTSDLSEETFYQKVMDLQSLATLMSAAAAASTPRLALRAFEEEVNVVLKHADEAPQEINLLRQFAKRRPKIAQLLIVSYNEDKSDIGWTSIFLAIALGKLNTAIKLRQMGAAIDRSTRFEHPTPSVLQLAVLCKDYSAALWAINEGVDVNAQGSSERTPLHNAMLGDNIKIMELLLNQRADPRVTDHQGWSVVALAQRYEKPKVLRWLLTLATYNAMNDGRSKATLLHHASNRARNVDAVRWLLKNGSEVNAKDSLLQTPLYMAIGAVKLAPRAAETVNLLLASGADTKCEDSRKRTPLQYAAELESWEAFRLLRDFETDMVAKDQNQRTPTQLLFPEEGT